MEKYNYMTLASKIYGVLGWIIIGLAPLAFIFGIVAGAVAKGGAGAALGFLLGIVYAVAMGISGVMMLASSQAFIWMIDMEGHAAAIRAATKPPAPGQ
jgi:hypothetical protein